MIIMTKEQYFLSKAYLVNDKIKICGEYYNSYTKIDVKNVIIFGVQNLLIY